MMPRMNDDDSLERVQNNRNQLDYIFAAKRTVKIRNQITEICRKDINGLLLHHVIVNERWYNCDGYNLFRLVDNSCNLFVFHADHILAIDLKQLMIDE